MTKGEAIQIISSWVTYAEAGERIGSENKPPNIQAIKRLLQEVKRCDGK